MEVVNEEEKEKEITVGKEAEVRVVFDRLVESAENYDMSNYEEHFKLFLSAIKELEKKIEITVGGE